MWEACSASPDLLVEFQARKKEEYREKDGWRNNGRQKTNRGRKGRGSASTPREVPSNFSAVVASTTVAGLST